MHGWQVSDGTECIGRRISHRLKCNRLAKISKISPKCIQYISNCLKCNRLAKISHKCIQYISKCQTCNRLAKYLSNAFYISNCLKCNRLAKISPKCIQYISNCLKCNRLAKICPIYIPKYPTMALKISNSQTTKMSSKHILTLPKIEPACQNFWQHSQIYHH